MLVSRSNYYLVMRPIVLEGNVSEETGRAVLFQMKRAAALAMPTAETEKEGK